jgi:hypothetical protein
MGAITVIATAPRHDCRTIGVGPITQLKSTSAGATKSAIWTALPSAIPTLSSSLFLRAAENAEPSQPPDQRHDNNSDKGKRDPGRDGRLLHRFDEDFAHERDQHSDGCKRYESQTQWPFRFTGFAVSNACKEFAMRLEREQQSQRVSNDERHGQPDTQGLRKRRIRGCGVSLGEQRWNQRRNRCQEKQARLKARGIAVELLHMVSEAAEQEWRTQHEL